MNKNDEILKAQERIMNRLSAEKDDRYKNLKIDEVIKIINQSSVNGKYSLWTVKEYLKGNIQRFEDIESRCKQGLEIFKNNLHKFTNEEKQIHKLTFHDLENLIQPFKDELSNKALKKIEKEKIWSEIDVIYDGPEGKILVPKTEQASIFLGKGTRWCTASLKNNMFRKYNNQGPLYVFITNDKDEQGREIKYQLHIKSGQFMDMEDEEAGKKDEKYSPLFQKLTVIKKDKLYKFLVNNIIFLDYFIDKDKENLRNKICLEAIKLDINCIKYIENPSDEIKLEAVKQDGWAIKYINNPSEEMKLEAVKRNGRTIQYIDNPTEEMKLIAVKENGWAIQYINNPTDEMQLIAVKKNGEAIQYINNPTDEMQLIAVKQNGNNIQYIDNPSEEIKLIAVKKDGEYIKYISNPTEEMKLIAIKSSGYAIQYIDNPSEQVMLEAVKERGWAIQFINNPTDEMQLIAFKKDNEYIRYINNPTEEIQLIAVKKDGEYIKYIENPSEMVIKVAKKQVSNYTINEYLEQLKNKNNITTEKTEQQIPQKRSMKL